MGSISSSVVLRVTYIICAALGLGAIVTIVVVLIGCAQPMPGLEEDEAGYEELRGKKAAGNAVGRRSEHNKN